MRVGYLDGDSHSYCHLLTIGHITTGAEDVQEQSYKRKAVRPKSLDRGTPSEHQTQCRGLNRTRSGEEVFMLHVIYAKFYNSHCSTVHILYSFLFEVRQFLHHL